MSLAAHNLPGGAAVASHLADAVTASFPDTATVHAGRLNAAASYQGGAPTARPDTSSTSPIAPRPAQIAAAGRGPAADTRDNRLVGLRLPRTGQSVPARDNRSAIEGELIIGRALVGADVPAVHLAQMNRVLGRGDRRITTPGQPLLKASANGPSGPATRTLTTLPVGLPIPPPSDDRKDKDATSTPRYADNSRPLTAAEQPIRTEVGIIRKSA
jgi:hypothetical protein